MVDGRYIGCGEAQRFVVVRGEDLGHGGANFFRLDGIDAGRRDLVHTLQWMLYNLLGGGLLLGAFFMATDYVTSPVAGEAHEHFGDIVHLLQAGQVALVEEGHGRGVGGRVKSPPGGDRSYIGTVALLTFLFPRGNDPLQWMLYNLLGGGLLLGALVNQPDRQVHHKNRVADALVIGAKIADKYGDKAAANAENRLGRAVPDLAQGHHLVHPRQLHRHGSPPDLPLPPRQRPDPVDAL